MARNLTHLPPATSTAGRPPDTTARFGHLLASAWNETYETDRAASHVPTERDGPWFWASQAHSCARQLSYRMLKVEASNPMTIADSWRFGIGESVHERLQTAIEAAFPGAQREVEVDLTTLGLRGSGRLDVLVGRTAIELKTIAGFGFKLAIGARGEAEGPRSSAVAQGALCALALDCDELVVIDLSLELLSARELAKLGAGKTEVDRFVAEWTYSRDEYEPVARAEIDRVNRVLALADEHRLAPRAIPGLPARARITDPMRGAWTVEVEGQVTQAGTHWGCDYCSYRTKCIADGPGVVLREVANVTK